MIIAPTITAQTPLSQSVRQHIYRSIVVSIASSEILVKNNKITPEELYLISVNALQTAGISL